jgi:uncharacterized protein YbjT (DUF2867 family)
MGSEELHVVTGAFGFSGKYIAQRLLDAGHRVRTLTNSPDRANPFEGKIEARPFDFDHPDRLAESLQGAAALYNTYWVRFDHKDFNHSQAVENTLNMFEAAKKAGVGRVVHVSITNPSEDSPLPYFSGKARLERALRESGLPHSILRPAVLFGREDILINNIAWMLRRFPVFAIFGDGKYRMQPIDVEDLADLAVEEGAGEGSRVIQATGPETFTYRELVATIARILGKRRLFVSIPATLGLWGGTLMGKLLGDVVITREEMEGLMADLLYVKEPGAGRTKLSDWVRENAESLGRRYASELARRRNRRKAYDQR